MATEELPGRPTEQYEVARPSRPRSMPVDETRAHEPADVTEPSPVVEGEPRESGPAALPAPAPAAANLTSPASLATADPALVIALTAFCLFGLGMLATLFPLGRIIGLCLAGLGLVTGLVCLLAEGRARQAGGGGAILNCVAILLLVFAPGWLGLLPWSEEETSDEPKVPVAIVHGTGEKTPADWVESQRASWQFGDVRITVKPVVVGPVELVGPGGEKKRSRERSLQIPIVLANIGASRRVEISGWATGARGDGARLTDQAGNVLTRETFDSGWEPAGQVKPNGLFPGNSAEIVLVYEAPSTRLDSLKLELPGPAIGTEHTIRFRLPVSLPNPISPRRP